MSRIEPAFAEAAKQAYRTYNDSEMQQRFRDEAPCWVGAVYWNPQDDNAETIRYELQRMRETGFTVVRFHCIDPEEGDDGSWDFTYTDLRMNIAQECGLQVYPHFPFKRPHKQALAESGLSADDVKVLGLADERVKALIRAKVEAIVGRYADHPALIGWPMAGEPPATALSLSNDTDKQRFLAWLQERYDEPRDVHNAWLIYPDRLQEYSRKQGWMAIDTWEDAVAIASRIKGPDKTNVMATTGMSRHELFGATRDLTRFRADQTAKEATLMVQLVKEFDSKNPVFYGNHQLMYSNGQLAWDQHQVGRTGDMHFSSIHLSWHFEAVHGELDRPHYMQSRLTSDIFKGGYTNCYETTSGPVQYSGGYGNHMDAGLMRKMMFNYLASGNEGIAFWDWIPRPGGIEAGEYGLVSLSGRITEWAREAGEVTRAMERHAKDIWHWQAHPELAIVRSWDTETVMTCEPKRFELFDCPTAWSNGPGQQHVRAWIGAGRAAIDDQIAFEYLTTDEIAAGLSGVYPAIYLPHVRCLDDATLEHLIAYVEAGGRVIADVQVGFEDQWGKVRLQRDQGLMDRLFGGWIDTIHDAATRPQTVDGVTVEGFFGEIVHNDAQVLRRFDTGKAAVIEVARGRGTATLIGFDAARQCWKPGNTAMQALLTDILRGPDAVRFKSDMAMTFRRSVADADHYFFINEGPKRSVILRVYDNSYSQVEDVMTGVQTAAASTIAVEVDAYSAAWIRCTRSPSA